MTTTKRIVNKQLVGIMGFAAIAAVLTVSMVAVSFQSQLAEAAAANKGGYATDIVEMAFDPSDVPTEAQVVANYYFKSSNFNEWGVNFIAECATANHIQGKGKMQDFEGATTGMKVYFTHTSPDGVEKVVKITGEEVDYTPGDVPDSAKWNMCSQTFEIKTQLNALIEECSLADTEDPTSKCFGGDVGDLRFVCNETDGNWDSEDCQQYVELFLENAGTHPAKVFLANVPHGNNEVTVYAEFNAESQGLDGDRTSIAIGKRMLDLYPVISDNNNYLK